MIEGGVYIFRNFYFTHALVANEEKSGASPRVELKPFKTRHIQDNALWVIEHVGNQSYDIYNISHFGGSMWFDGGVLIDERWKLTSDAKGKLTIDKTDKAWQFKKNPPSGSLQSAYQIISSSSQNAIDVIDETSVLHQPVDDGEDKDMASYWDIQHVRESYFAIRSIKNGQYLCTDKDRNVILKECGTPREFLWYVYNKGDSGSDGGNITTKRCFLRNLKTNAFLQIVNGFEEEVGAFPYAYDPWSVDLPKNVCWDIVNTAEDRVMIINQASSAVIQRDAFLEVTHDDKTNGEMEVKSYRVTWSKYHVDSAPDHSTWIVERVGPSNNFVLHSLIEVESGFADIAAELASGKTAKELREEAIGKKSMISVLKELDLQADKTTVMTPAPPPVGRDDSPTPGTAVVVGNISQSHTKIWVPNEGLFYQLEDSVVETSWKLDQLTAELMETVRKVEALNHVVSDVIVCQTTDIRQKLSSSFDLLSSKMLPLIDPNLITLLMEPLKGIIDQTVQEELTPIRMNIASLEARIVKLKADK